MFLIRKLQSSNVSYTGTNILISSSVLLDLPVLFQTRLLFFVKKIIIMLLLYHICWFDTINM